ncbi:hypothetical protein ACJJTC_006317 [Scirpophaga incertulas]
MAALKLRQVEKGGSVIHGDSGPPPLTITSPSDKYDEATGGPSGTTQEAPKAQEVPKTQEDAKAQPAGNNRGASNNNGSPGSPKPAYTGPYRSVPLNLIYQALNHLTFSSKPSHLLDYKFYSILIYCLGASTVVASPAGVAAAVHGDPRKGTHRRQSPSAPFPAPPDPNPTTHISPKHRNP